MTSDPATIQAKFQEAFAWHQKGQTEAARRLYGEVLAAAPGHFDALHFSGVIAAQSGEFGQAVELIERAIAINAGNAGAHHNLGLALAGVKRHEDALAAHGRALALNPQHLGAHLNSGAILANLGRLPEALAAFDKALALTPNNADAQYSRGSILLALGRSAEALQAFDQALALKPSHLTHFARGKTLRQLGRLEEALRAFDEVIAYKTDLTEVFNERGILLTMLKQPQAALISFTAAIRLNPNYADAHANLAVALNDMRRFDEAIASSDKAIALNPKAAEAHHTRAVALAALLRNAEAVDGYRKAVALRPDLAEAHANLGYVLFDLRKYQEALTAFDAALALKPDYPFLFGTRLHVRAHMCRWENFAAERALLADKVARGEKAIPPLSALTLLDSPLLHRKAAEAWTQLRHGEDTSLGMLLKRPFKAADKIRVGYFSVDFRNHAVAVLMAGLIDQHDRTRFEVYGFSYGVNTQDALRKRLEISFDKFFDVRDQPDRAIAALARQHGIDIAVDLGGHTGDGRANIFACRAAPIQVNYLGYPGTMAAPYMDYIIADKVVIPADERRHYAEKVVWLPNTYQANDSHRFAADRPFTRAEVGLPPQAFVFACFNSVFKIMPEVFEAWMEILRGVKDSVLWLLEDLPEAMDNMRRYAQAQGIDPARLIFAPRMPMQDHVARQRLADLFLDTVPYNAHTTASDALWVGLPVLTQPGQSFPSRVAASLLRAIALPELVVESRKDYIERAIALGRDPRWIQDTKEKLARHRITAPLFDTAGFARYLEDAYHEMHLRHRNGEPPDHIVVAP